MIIRISPREIDLINHRLAVPDCIAECLEDEFSQEEIHNAIERVRIFVSAGFINIDLLEEIDRQVLSDCIEGSTWISAAMEEALETRNSAIKSGAVRTIMALTAKFRKVNIPVSHMPIW